MLPSTCCGAQNQQPRVVQSIGPGAEVRYLLYLILEVVIIVILRSWRWWLLAKSRRLHVHLSKVVIYKLS